MMKILVFLHGTAIMQSGGLGKTPDERGKQVEENEESIHQYENYVPVDNVVEKLNKWVKQGAEILYLSSHESQEYVDKDRLVLDRYNFPKGQIYWRQDGENYAEVVETIMPDILIEDDCECIGGEAEMTYPNLKPEIKEKIKSIVVKEFEGIDHLPDNISELKNF